MCLAAFVGNGIGTAFLCTVSAAAALLFNDMRLPGVVLVHLAGAASASHTDIFECSAEAGCLMTFEMGETDQDVGVHDGMADICLLEIFTVPDRDNHLIGSAQTVADDDVASGGRHAEAVLFSTAQMIERVLPASGIERIAVGQEGLSAEFLYHVSDCFCVVRTQIGDVAELAEMHLDCYKLSIHVNAADSCLADQLRQLPRQARAICVCTKVGKIDL